MFLRSFSVNRKHPFPTEHLDRDQYGFMASQDGLILNIFWKDVGPQELALARGTVLGLAYYREDKYDLGSLCLFCSDWPEGSGVPTDQDDLNMELVGAPLVTSRLATLENWLEINEISYLDADGAVLKNSGQYDYFLRLTIIVTQIPSTIIHSVRHIYLPTDLVHDIQQNIRNCLNQESTMHSALLDMDLLKKSWECGDKWVYSFVTENFVKVSSNVI